MIFIFDTELCVVEKNFLKIVREIIKEISFAIMLEVMEDESCHFRRMAGTIIKL
jgi:hypothetical protein